MHHRTGFRWAVIAICLLAFVAAVLFADRINHRLPHSEDEVAYLFQAKVFTLNRLSVPTPPLADAFWSPFVVDYQGRRFGKYPPGWPFLLSLGLRLGAGWLVNPLLGAVTLAMVAWLGRQMFDRRTGLLAAALGVVTPAFLFQSGSLLSHPASLFWNTLALVFLVRLTRTRRPLDALGVGVFLAAAFVTRPFAGLGIGLPVAGWLGWQVARKTLPRRLLGWTAAGGLVAALLPLYWLGTTGNPFLNPYLLVWPYDRVGFGPDIGPHGYTITDAIFIGARLKLVTLGRGLFGWPGWSNLLFLAVPFLTRRARHWDRFLLAAIGGLVLVHIFYWAFGGADGGLPRYYYDALPAFLLLTARGVFISIDLLQRVKLAGGRLSAGILPPVLVALLTLYSLGWTLPPLLVAQKDKYGITPAPLEAVRRAGLPAPALVLVQDVRRWTDFAAAFSANSPLLDGPVVYAIDWGPDYHRALQALFKDRACFELHGDTLVPCRNQNGGRP
ncbi:MAG: phospholipid carrier-dependent glycosyltransferase [Chloroflexi bacterium]|nr:MAG: phospholipid carrier-dependent glycosyltransferase [Chloroflexota bacterium]